MQMRMTYLPVNYKDEAPGSIISQNLFDPEARVKSFDVDTQFYDQHLNDMGEQGWNLVSIQPLPRVEYTETQNISLVGGFYLFWQKGAQGAASVSPFQQPQAFPSMHSTAPDQPMAASSEGLRTEPSMPPHTPPHMMTQKESNPFLDEIGDSIKPMQSEPVSFGNKDVKNRVNSIKDMLKGNAPTEVPAEHIETNEEILAVNSYDNSKYKEADKDFKGNSSFLDFELQIDEPTMEDIEDDFLKEK